MLTSVEFLSSSAISAKLAAACSLWLSALACCSTAAVASFTALLCSSAALAIAWEPLCIVSTSLVNCSNFSPAWVRFKTAFCINSFNFTPCSATSLPWFAACSIKFLTSSILVLTLSTLFCIFSTAPFVVSALFALTSAKLLVSSATTANPFPCSLARAASIAALRASKLVCSAASAIIPTLFPILLLASFSFSLWDAIPSATLLACIILFALFWTKLTASFIVLWEFLISSIVWFASFVIISVLLCISLTAASDSSAAPAFCSAAAAICSIALFSCSTALTASWVLANNSDETDEIVSLSCCCLAKVLFLFLSLALPKLLFEVIGFETLDPLPALTVVEAPLFLINAIISP